MTKRDAMIIALGMSSTLLNNKSVFAGLDDDEDYTPDDAKKIREAIQIVSDQLYDRYTKMRNRPEPEPAREGKR